MVEYLETSDGITADRLSGGFFEGWPSPPDPERHLAHLRGAEAVVLAVDPASGDVVGFITAIGDAGLVAFIPLLEVLPAWRGQGIGGGSWSGGCWRDWRVATPSTLSVTRSWCRSTNDWTGPGAAP
jgi:GNAT superfamily N-acetyltransferase